VIGTIDPVVEWHKGSFTEYPSYDQVMMQPVAANLTDDNGDGVIDEDDVPDVVLTRFTGSSYGSVGVITALSGDDGHELWSIASFVLDGTTYQPYSSSGVAIGDLDGDGLPEVCFSTPSGLACVTVAAPGSGSAVPTGRFVAGDCGTNPYVLPAIADVDHDGLAEVIFRSCVFAYDGTFVGSPASLTNASITSFAVNMDDDPELEVVDGVRVYDLPPAGSTTMPVRYALEGVGAAFAAVGDFDGDGMPEIAAVETATAKVYLYDPDGATDADTKDGWTVTIADGGSGARGGPPTVADFDGDGEVEVGVAAEYQYTVYDNNGTRLWGTNTQDASSRDTGSSVFDFDGDGAAEVVYADEQNLHIYDGKTGAERATISDHGSGTIVEYPIVVDIDHDGESEIVLASNNYAFAGWTGITVLGSESRSWTPARPVWNQYAYSISNVNDDGSIP
ncbi:MAG: VCBS repeat-containing protein, partial [Myxococcales bacterium]|nr:VCBS repeat-containing protein [Myxococcales bacterium]